MTYFKLVSVVFALFVVDLIKISAVKNAPRNSSSIHLIVARYKEDIAWIRDISIPKSHIFVYQKINSSQHNVTAQKAHFSSYQKKISIAHTRTRFIENVGNECHAYLKHIVDNYNHLPEYCIFVHGDPGEHCPNFMEYLNNAPVYSSKQDFVAGKKPTELLHFTQGYSNNSQLSLRQFIPELFTYYKKWFNRPIAEYGTSIWNNAQFQVSRDRIHLRPLSFWQDLLKDLTSNDKLHKSEHNAHGVFLCGYLEQVWHELFGNPPVTDVRSTAYYPNGKEHFTCNRDEFAPIFDGGQKQEVILTDFAH